MKRWMYADSGSPASSPGPGVVEMTESEAKRRTNILREANLRRETGEECTTEQNIDPVVTEAIRAIVKRSVRDAFSDAGWRKCKSCGKMFTQSDKIKDMCRRCECADIEMPDISQKYAEVANQLAKGFHAKHGVRANRLIVPIEEAAIWEKVKTLYGLGIVIADVEHVLVGREMTS